MALEQLRLHCDCPPVHETRYDPTSDTTITGTVVDAIATAADVDPIDLQPLNESIDPDALEQLFEKRGDDGDNAMVLGFTVDGWNVFVCGDGHIRVCDSSERTDASVRSDSTRARRTD